MIYNIYKPDGSLSFSIESSSNEFNFSLESLSNTVDNMLDNACKYIDTLSVCSAEGFKEGMKNVGKAIAKKFTEILDKIGEIFEKIRSNIQKIIVGKYQPKFNRVISEVESLRKDFTREEQVTVNYDFNRYLFKFKGDVSNVYSKIPGFNYNDKVFETMILCDTFFSNEGVKEFLKEESIDEILNGNHKEAIEKVTKAINEGVTKNYAEYTRSDDIVLSKIKGIYGRVKVLDRIAESSNAKVKTMKKALKELEKRDTMYGKQEYIMKRISVLNGISKRCTRGISVLNTQIILPIAKYKWYTNRLDEKE